MGVNVGGTRCSAVVDLRFFLIRGHKGATIYTKGRIICPTCTIPKSVRCTYARPDARDHVPGFLGVTALHDMLVEGKLASVVGTPVEYLLLPLCLALSQVVTFHTHHSRLWPCTFTIAHRQMYTASSSGLSLSLLSVQSLLCLPSAHRGRTDLAPPVGEQEREGDQSEWRRMVPLSSQSDKLH